MLEIGHLGLGMRDVSIIGIGQTEVAEHWDRSLRHLAGDAILAAIHDAGLEPLGVDALYVGNMLSGLLTGQEHLGPLIADFVGLRGIEAVKVEAACGSGAAALRLGYATVAGGLHDFVIVCGVEKMTDTVNAETTTGLAMAADADYESIHGVTFVSLNALLMRRYMHEYGVEHKDFAHFTVNAHRNAVGNPNAMFRREVSAEFFARARMIADPINLLRLVGHRRWGSRGGNLPDSHRRRISPGWRDTDQGLGHGHRHRRRTRSTRSAMAFGSRGIRVQGLPAGRRRTA